MGRKQLSYGLKKRVRMRDVADRTGVSISTVSLVLSGDVRIPEDTTRRVLQAVKAMEYRPSVLARNLARRVSRTIGVILPQYAFDKNQPFYYQALQGIHAQTQPAGFKLVVEAASPAFLDRRYYLRLLKEQSADGMVYLAASLQDRFLAEMAKEPYPFVLVGSYAEGVNLLCARGDDYRGGKIATRHLLQLGHQAVGHIAGAKAVSNGWERERGYRESMKEAGISVPPEWVVPGNFDVQEAEKGTPRLVERGVTAIFAASDVMALGVLRALRKIGRRVPEDIAVVGMDDLEVASWVDPALTTVQYDIASMAGQAAKLVIKRIQNPVTLTDDLGPMPSPKLVIRSTCGSKEMNS